MTALNGTKLCKIIGITALPGIVLAAGLFVYSGAYDVAADVPHTKPVLWVLNTTRERSIAMRARNVAVPPDLANPARIAVGAGLYNEMCSSCHLAPGMGKTEISQGLYPPAPELTHGSDLSPAEEFWVIKHGLKMTGMAAWGKTHDDTLVWNMVAFLQKMPKLSPEQYKALVKSAPENHNEMMKIKDMDHDH